MDIPASPPPLATRRFVLLAYPFRPFFLATATYAIVVMAVWVAALFADYSPPLSMAASQWHGHEMLFGVVPPAVAGFLLTAMCAWTGARPLRGGGLAALVGCWFAGRVAMFFSVDLPAPLVAAIDLAFLPAVGVYAARVLLAHGNRRNLVLVAVIGGLALADLATHLEFAGAWLGGARFGETLALDLLVTMMLVIGARITPSFTANWLRSNGRDPSVIRRSDRLDGWATASALLVAVVDAVALLNPGEAMSLAVAVAASAAAILNAYRLWQWHGWVAAREPLLWILHVGIAWIVVAFAVKALTPLVHLAPGAWIHAAGVGAAGTMVLGVMTRVALGHTGRPLRLPRLGVGIYLAVTVAALARAAAALGLGPLQDLLAVAAHAWLLAFLQFVVLYSPILTSPRADGRPG